MPRCQIGGPTAAGARGPSCSLVLLLHRDEAEVQETWRRGVGGGGWGGAGGGVGRARWGDEAQRVHGRSGPAPRRPLRSRRRRPRLRPLAQERGERGEVEDHHGRRHAQEGGGWRRSRHHQRPR
uniref:Uncharacterized protein n=1 Tax=Arundo donax TaxID=35708 RepID=A0A0A9HRE4_ARUDO